MISMFAKNKLKTFRGGIHPHIERSLCGAKKSVEIPLPVKVRIPLQQHIGAPAVPVVKAGDSVKTGQVIGEAGGFVSSYIHASVSGKVTGVKKFPVAVHKRAVCVEIESDGLDERVWDANLREWNKLSVTQIRESILNAGIVGMGGAAFPTHVKVSPPDNKKIDRVIINGVECEPYLDADRTVMTKFPDKVLQGLLIVMKLVDCADGYIGIEANKPDAIEIMDNTARELSQVDVIPLRVKYPQGAEKQLIYAVTGREVPFGGLPMDVGALVINAGTAMAVYDAVVYNKPLIERTMTIAGSCLEQSVNLTARIGTMVTDIIDGIGGFSTSPTKAVMGGPMMGEVLTSYEIPVVKGTSGLLFLTEPETDTYRMGPCIRCGKCVDICPMGISPAMICQAVEFGDYELAEKLGLFNCMKCGCCTYICPSSRELVQLIKLGEYNLKIIKDKKRE